MFTTISSIKILFAKNVNANVALRCIRGIIDDQCFNYFFFVGAKQNPVSEQRDVDELIS